MLTFADRSVKMLKLYTNIRFSAENWWSQLFPITILKSI